MTTYSIRALDKVVNEGDSGLTAIRFRITRDDATREEIVHTRLSSAGTDKFDGLQFGTQGHGLGTHSSDGSTSSDFKFSVGEYSRDIVVYVRGDEYLETNEIIRLTLTGAHDAATNSSLGAMNKSDVAVVMNDDNAESKGATEVHANAVLADGHVDSAEEHVVRPMTRLEAKTKALKDAMKELEEATKDGELTQDEIDALHKAYDGYGKYMKKLLDGKIQKEQERLEKEKAEGGDANLSNRIDEQETEEHLASADTETGGFWGAEDDGSFGEAIAAFAKSENQPSAADEFYELNGMSEEASGFEAPVSPEFNEAMLADLLDSGQSESDWIL